MTNFIYDIIPGPTPNPPGDIGDASFLSENPWFLPTVIGGALVVAGLAVALIIIIKRRKNNVAASLAEESSKDLDK